MRVIRRLLLLALLMGRDGPCLAQDVGSVRSDWETSAVEKLGPLEAAGVLLYVHVEGPDAVQMPVPTIFVAMAKVAKWDVLRINLPGFVDVEARQSEIRSIVADRIAAAREEGYREIIAAGVARGGWMALAASTLPEIDASIALAPTTGSIDRRDQQRTRDLLARMLVKAKARRIAAF